MLKVVVSFAVGVLVTSAVFLLWDGPSDGKAVRDHNVVVDREDDFLLQPRQNPSDEVAADSDARNTVITSSDAQSAANSEVTEDVEDQGAGPFVRFAALLQTTPEEVERILERSFETLSATPDRHSTFEREARVLDPTSSSLQGVLVNEAWSTAPTESTPLSIDTECRASACRVRYAFATDDHFLAAAKSAIDVKLLVRLEEYGIAAADTLIGDDDSRTLDVYLWRAGDSTP
jgi:hypothetical protein